MTHETLIFSLFALIVFGGVAQITFLFFLARMQRELVGDTLDTMSKIAQIGFIHSAAETPFDAVKATTILENEMQALEAAEGELKKEVEAPRPIKKGRLVGFKGPNGQIVKFMTNPPDSFIRAIPEDRLVYQ